MPKITGNATWYDQVHAVMQAEGLDMRDAELVLFEKVCRGMLAEGKSWGQIRAHYKTIYNIGHCAFYTRLRKVRRTVPLI